jgi:peptidyl-tRNA hydrolase, PTH1 family
MLNDDRAFHHPHDRRPGQPGPEYAQTRHNAGFWLVDRLLDRHGGSFRTERKFAAEVAAARIEGVDILLLKPQAFMNRSGGPVQAASAYLKIPVEQILVAHDELDLPPGDARLKQGGGHGGHNGLRSMISHLGRLLAIAARHRASRAIAPKSSTTC